MRSHAGRAMLAALAALIALGCAPKPPPPTPLAVFAASSLTEGFEALAEAFERDHPTVDVRLAFAGSQILRVQIEHGAAADVFASADPAHMQALVDGRLIPGSHPFAGNGLVVIVPADNPAGLAAFADLPRARRLVIGADSVPIGRYTRRLLARIEAEGPRHGLPADFAARVRGHVVSEETNARLVRAKVELGEADAAVVYRTDAAAGRRVRALPVPAALDVPARYAIGRLTRSAHGAEADAFVAFVRSPAGQRILAEHGFSAP